MKDEGRMQNAVAVAAGVHALRDEHPRTIEPALSLAPETLRLERTFKAEG